MIMREVRFLFTKGLMNVCVSLAWKIKKKKTDLAIVVFSFYCQLKVEENKGELGNCV